MKDWSCPKKIQARCDTILSHPKPMHQYWSMAGLNTAPGCEVDQLLRNNFIEPSQFQGVEHDRDIYEQNIQAYPDLNWHHGDFFQVMRTYPDFNPSFVNADLLQSVDTAADFVARLMVLLMPFEATLLVNFIMRHRGVNKTPEDVVMRLSQCQQFRHAMNNGWSYDGRCYLYEGTGRSNTTMGTFLFDNACSAA